MISSKTASSLINQVLEANAIFMGSDICTTSFDKFTTTVQYWFVQSAIKVVHYGTPIKSRDASYLSFTNEATSFTPERVYDYIIVGGGTAGCSLAATLSESYSVLLLERGGVADSDPNVSYAINSVTNIINANENSSPAQAFTSEDGIQNARGHVLGGSSMVNFGFYSRADEYFYNKTEIEWDMTKVEEAYKWVEDSVVWVPERLNSWQTSTLDALLESGVGPANGFTVDHLQGSKVSGSTFDGSGRRHGAVELLNKANPENLRVVVHATVDRIMFSISKNLDLAAVGVVYHDSLGRQQKVHVRNGEVILCAGAIGSPQLLLLSGIGHGSYLESQNITVVHQHPFVGQFIADNPRIGISLLVPFRLDDFGSQVVGITNEGIYIESSSSIIPFDSPASFIFFPHTSFPLNISVVSIAAKVSKPLSNGFLSLKSANDVTVTPKVRYNYFSNSQDLAQCTNAVDVIRRMLKTRAMEIYKFSDRDGENYFNFIGHSLPESSSNEDTIETFCREVLTTFYHFHGGCLVNKVVDRNLKVIGIDSLRVVDGSVFSHSPGTNPQATVMMLGRYIGTRILKERG